MQRNKLQNKLFTVENLFLSEKREPSYKKWDL